MVYVFRCLLVVVLSLFGSGAFAQSSTQQTIRIEQIYVDGTDVPAHASEWIDYYADLADEDPSYRNKYIVIIGSDGSRLYLYIDGGGIPRRTSGGSSGPGTFWYDGGGYEIWVVDCSVGEGGSCHME